MKESARGRWIVWPISHGRDVIETRREREDRKGEVEKGVNDFGSVPKFWPQDEARRRKRVFGRKRERPD